MDKKMLESYAIWAKKNLEQQVEVSLNKIGIHSDTDIKKMHISGDIATIDGDQTSYTLDFANKRKSVVRMVETDGYSTVISETAYTWFNRLIALRFMELHGYLSHGFRILSNPNNSVEPEILKNLNLVKFDLSLDMDYCDKLKSDNRIEELFRHVLLKQCQVLSKTIPMLFSENTDAYELLLPNTLITGESVLTKLLEIPEENFLDDVEVIGWLYQYYNTEQNKLVYNGKLSKEKIPKELIPAATTIYTPDWSVKYMVENSLGKLLSQMLPDFDTKSNWRYYLEDTTSKQEKTHSMSIEEVKFIDPCMGSGHILVYAFDVFMQIYRFCGYSDKDAVRSIIINNLYGLDIDKRAYQLACFAVIMRAQKYDKRFLRTLENEELSLNLSHFQNLHIENVNFLDKPIQSLIEQFKNADTYGSIIKITAQEGLEDYLESYVPTIDFDDEHEKHYYKLYQILTQKYEVICTNPPYLGSNRFNATLADYTKKHFNDEKSDLSMVMFRHCVDSLSAQNGYIAFITTSSWFSLSSFEKLRKYIIMNYQIESIVDYGTELFDGKVGHNPIVSWVLKKATPLKRVIAIKLVDYCYSRRREKEKEFFNLNNRYFIKQENFFRIPGVPIVYWGSESFYKAYDFKPLGEIGKAKSGLQTGNNDLYLKFWQEVSYEKIAFKMKSKQDYLSSHKKWVPQIKGGKYRKWYGNFDYVVNWENDGYEIRNCSGCRLNAMGNDDLFFIEGLTWSHTTSNVFGARYLPLGFLFNVEAPTYFIKEDNEYYVLGFLNSCVAQLYLNVNSTMHYLVGNIMALPLMYSNKYKNDIDCLVAENIDICKIDWDNFEMSWDFKEHPFVKWSKELWDATSIGATMMHYYNEHIEVCCPLELCYMLWQGECNDRFNKLKANEEELNRIFIGIYGLQEELTPEVIDKDVTVYSANLQDDMKSFISYLVGIIMGRYSLDYEGIAYAGGEWDDSRYKSYIPDDDGIVPIYPFVGMEIGLTAQICNLVKQIFGEDCYRTNMEYIAQALGKKNTESAEETLNRYLNNDFYTDHLKHYKKCPIYWMMSSGSEGGFKCLIYMHRYNEDTLARTNTMYYLPDSTRLKNELDETLVALTTASGKDKIALEKKRQILAARYNEALEYGQILDYMANKYISIDLDDGVKVNYEKFQNIEITTDNGTKVRKDLLIPLK